jgi:tetratricopeptide (TPR) repeat protein
VAAKDAAHTGYAAQWRPNYMLARAVSPSQDAWKGREMRQHPPVIAHDLAIQAADLLRERQNQGARDLLVQITGPDEGSAIDWYHLGIAEQRLKNYDAALATYHRALELEPTYCKSLIAASSLEWRMRRWRAAWQHFSQALQTE